MKPSHAKPLENAFDTVRRAHGHPKEKNPSASAKAAAKTRPRLKAKIPG